MEPFSIHPGGCSCSGCVYRSRSKEPSVQKLLQEGSDIDKIYLGKFLPLRERKLLERLIRTRDVYDDVRNQLLSSASDETIPKHKKKRRDEDLSSEQSSAVLKMVDLVDRGQIGPANERKKVRGRHKKHHKEHRHIESANASKAKLGSCCSCCSCETLKKIRKQMEREDKKHPKVHRQIVTCEDIAKYCEEAEKKGRKRRRKLTTKFSKLSSKVGSARLKIKRNFSEPTVMSKSRAFVNRIRSKRKATDSSTEILARDQQTKTAKGQRRKVKKNQSHSAEDSATVLGTLADKIIKDSLILFKEKLLKKRPYDKNKLVECEPGTCEEGTCSPEECFKKIKSKGVGDTRRRKHQNRHSETGRHKSHISMKIRPKKVKVRESQVRIAKTKSSSSLTISKTELKGNIPVSPKPVKGKHGKALSKSAASMTSLPKFKVKAQLATEEAKVAPKLKTKAKRRPVARDKNLEENVPVEVLPISKAKTKTATKSISSSLTSVAKDKVTKARSKSIKTLERHEGEPASPRKRHKTGRQKPRRETLQDMEETDMQEPIEHVKAKKEKRMKPTHGWKQRQKYKHSITQCACASPKASKHSRDSASQSSKPHGRNVLSKSQGRSALASMERLKRKSVESAAFSQKTSSGSRTKSKQQQSKSAVSFPKKSKYILKELPPEIEENYIEGYPNRQAVKISSSFSFNIEFYKDTYPLEVDEQPDFEPPQTPRTRRRINQTQRRRKFKDQANGHIRSWHNMSSQSGSTQSFKSTQVAHKLKRCFCTQKLIQTKKQKLNYVESKKTMALLDTKHREVVARQIRTQTKHSGLSYVVPPSTSTQFVRIRRASKHVSRDKNTTDTQGFAHSPKVSSDRWDGTGQRKAVRVGSNFNVSVEFSKTNINDRVTANAMIYDRPIQMERRQTRPKGIKVYKPSVRHEISETTRINVKTKQTRTEPFLQRCLCTLKLLKKNKKKVENLSPWRNRDEYVMHMQNGAENRYNLERSKFLPYACEPGSCIPKEYHPYDCKKRKKLRQIKLKHKYSNKCDLGSRSIFSKTSENTTSSDSQNTQFFTRESRQKVNKINQHYNEMYITRDRFKQRVMRGGSNLSSKIEFSKEKSAHYERKDNFITTDEDCINKHIQNKYKSNTKGSQEVEHPAHHTSIDTKPKLEKGSSVVSVIKKCFSILKFPRKTNKLEVQNKINVISESKRTSYSFPSSQISEYKNTRARSRKLLYDSSSYERSPNFVIPGTTPYERHEENKRRDIIKLDKPYTNVNRPNRKSVMSVTSGFSGSTKAKSTQSRLLKHRTKEYQKVRHKQRGMKAARSFSTSRLTVCEGSNFSFDKKKSTNRFIPSIRNTTIKNRVEKYNTVSDISSNRMKDQLYPSQENNFRKEHKASDIALFLNKCFCRLGLQKKYVPEREFHWQQPITTQFVQVEHNNKKKNRHNVTKSGCNFVNKTLNTKEPLLSKLREDSYVFKENLFESQNVVKTPRYTGSHHLPNGSFTRRGHIRSQIDVNFDKMKKILNIKKINPFYQSFYALNVKVSKSNVKSYGSIDSKASKKLSDCALGQCDAEDCIKRVSRLKRMKQLLAPDPSMKQSLAPDPPMKQSLAPDPPMKKSLAPVPPMKKSLAPVPPMKKSLAPVPPMKKSLAPDPPMKKSLAPDQPMKQSLAPDRPIPPCKDMPDTTKFDCYERCKREFGKREKKVKPPPGPYKPLILGSDFKVRAGVYKDTNPYKDSHRQAVRIGTDARVDVDFFREPTRRNICLTGPIPAGPIPKDRMMMGSRYSFGRKSKQVEDRMSLGHKSRQVEDTTPNDEHRQKFSGIKLMMKRLSKGSAKLKRSARSDINQRISEISIYRDPRERKSTPRLPYRRESSKSGYVQCKECAPQQQKPARKSTFRNNVTFCTDVNCLEYAKEPIRKGEGDVGKQYGSKTVMDCLCRLKKNIDKCMCETKTEAKIPTICTCGAKTKAKSPTICTCGADFTCGAKTKAKSPTICTCGAKTKAKSPTICTCGAKTKALFRLKKKIDKCMCETNTEANIPTICTCGAKTKAKSPTICTCGADFTCGAKTKAKSPTICTCGAKTKAKSPTICTCGAKTKAKSPTICTCGADFTCGAKTKAKSPAICTCGAKTKAKSPTICTCGAKTKAKSPTICTCGAKTKAKSPAICTCGAKTKAKSPTICMCGAKTEACTCGANTNANNICKQLEEAEREMETIMPYSKKKFKKFGSQSKLPPDEQNMCASKCRSVTKEVKEAKKVAKAKAKDEAKDEAIDEAKDETKDEAKDGAKDEAKDKAKDEAKESVKRKSILKVRKSSPFAIKGGSGEAVVKKVAKTKEEAKDEAKEEAKDGAKDEAKESVKKKSIFKVRKSSPSAIKGDPGAAVVKKVAKAEAKDEAKDETKDGAKDDAKDEAKECVTKKSTFKVRKSSPFAIKGGSRAAVVEKPVDNSPCFEITLNTTNMEIVNKEEVLKEISKSKEAADGQEKVVKDALGHGSKCKCCVCHGLKKGKGVAAAPLAMKMKSGDLKQAKLKETAYQKEHIKALKQATLKEKVYQKEHVKALQQAELKEKAYQKEHVKALKQAKLKEKAYQKGRKQRMKEREKERKIEEKLTNQMDKAQMKSIRKIKDAGDVSLIAGSLVDLGSFGSKAFCDISRYIFRGAVHPRDVVTDFQDAMIDPGAAAKTMRRDLKKMGLDSTIERIKARFKKMKTPKLAIKTLESYPTTNFIVHMADKDRKKRMKKFKKKKHVREQIQVGCSAYMASMRKKPCLRIYYMCPWFYPHCLSLLGVWKQLQDIVLFILAVAVWSPCIMCMELIRGFCCCIMCQG